MLAAALIAGGSGLARAQTAPVAITNTAQLSYRENGASQTISSNTVQAQVSARKRPVMSLMRLAVGAPGAMTSVDNSRCRTAMGAWAPPGATGDQAFNADGVALRPASSFHAGEPIFIGVDAPESNIDPTARDHVQVKLSTSGGDREVVSMEETGPNTGYFVGYVTTSDAKAVTPYDCNVVAPRGLQITAELDDDYDDTVMTAAALVDPYGYVFDARTGKPVNGARVTLIDDATGEPAAVFGDDGMSPYPSSVISGADVTDEGGAIYQFTDGEYRFPLIAKGSYHLKIEPPPGYGAPSTATPAFLAQFKAPDGADFAIIRGSYGETFVLDQDEPLKLDVPIDPHLGGMLLKKTASVDEAEVGDFVRYRLELTNRDARVPLQQVRVVDVLPKGFRYVPGSSRLDGARIADPAIEAGGRRLTYSLGTFAGGVIARIDYVTAAGAGTPTGEAINRATVSAGGAVDSATAEALVRIRAPLFSDAFTLIGRVTDSACESERDGRQGVAGVRLLLNDGTYVVTDRDGLYHFEGLRPGLHVVQVDLASLPDGYEVVSCGDDTRQAGRAFSRFVEGQGGVLKRADFHLRPKAGAPAGVIVPTLDPVVRVVVQPAGKAAAVARSTGRSLSSLVKGLAARLPGLQRVSAVAPEAPVIAPVLEAVPAPAPVAEVPAAVAPVTVQPPVAPTPSPARLDDAKAAGEGVDWTQGQEPGLAWLFPAAEHNPRAPVVRVAIKHQPGQRIALFVNGAPVETLSREQSQSGADGLVQVARWSGVVLKDGDNRLEARVSDAEGRPVQTLVRVVHYANVAAGAEVVPERSRLVADGKTQPVVAVRVVDRDGRPVRAGSMGTFQVASPYVAAQEVQAQQERQLQGLDARVTTWRVEGDDGIALIPLAPTTQTGHVSIDLPLAGQPIGRPLRLKAWLKAGAEDWIVVGFASGTVGFDALSRGLRPLAKGEKPDQLDGQVSLYAKGRVRGDWVATLSYDSKRGPEDRRGLLSVIDPDRYYTVYGDGAAQAYDAPTQGKLYLRLERDAFYALFGDFEAGFDGSDLGRYVRTLHGAKFERQGRVLSFGGFASQTRQDYVRDEIQGSGLSGPYRLSRRQILPNTDRLVIETRDRVRAERVVATRVLARHVDYDIDYAGGLVTFRAPVTSVDDALNPNVIVAEYEVDGNGEKTLEAGLRAEARISDRVTADAALLHGRPGARSAEVDVLAVGATLRPTASTQVRLEAAASQSDAPLARRQSAYLAEVRHATGATEVTAYARQADADFGLGQQAITGLGARKIGVDGKVALGKALTLSGTAYSETFLQTGAERRLVDARLDYVVDGWTLTSGVKAVRDETSEPAAESRLLTLGAGRSFLDQRLRLNLSTDIPLGVADSVDFPARTRLTAAYAVNDATRVLVSHEITDGGRYRGATTRAGFEVSPWKGATLSNSLGRQDIGEYGPRTFAQLGLTQSLRLSERLTVDASVDGSRTLSGAAPLAGAVDPTRPTTGGGTTSSTVGQNGLGAGLIAEDFTAVSLGAAYRAERWSWNGRAEVRDGQAADTWSLRTAYLRQLREGVTATAAIRAHDTRTREGGQAGALEVDSALAWRPLDSRWSVLNRLVLRQETARDTAAQTDLSGYTPLAIEDGSARRVINNLSVNYDGDSDRGRGGLQASAYLGLKYVSSTFGADTYTGAAQILGAEARYDLGRRIDIGFAAALRHVGATRDLDYAFGPSIGVSPADNTWISLGWNVKGFADRDFEENRYTRQGAYLTVRFKFDQFSLGRRAR
ncbi:hypothetical protein AS593_00545 [Caulobacter vibrioides]|nr:hypothetical protein AS593_00545 [Caulobacter vibrioides]